MKAPWKIKLLGIFLILIFGLGTLLAVATFTSESVGSRSHRLFDIVTNLGFVAGGIGLLKLKRWSQWLTIGLCAVSIVQLLWRLFMTLTAESATRQNEVASYIVAGFFLAIVFLLTSDSSRKAFREANWTPQSGP